MIELQNLTKKFENKTAVNHINLKIQTGEFFGLLGQNGAGKTTTISMLSTLMLPTEGTILFDGEILSRKSKNVKRQVSVVTQEFSMRQDMNMDEVMEYQGRLYFMSLKDIRQKTEQLLDFAGLIEHRDKKIRHLSGGMKRKLMVCRALLTEPKVLLLDEPTAGMDAIARRQMWSLLSKLKNDGLTILLTTHYMEEAEALCDRVAFLDDGNIIQLDSPASLISKLGEFTIEEYVHDEIKNYYFEKKENALSYINNSDNKCNLRATTLEDVFIECVYNWKGISPSQL